MNIKGETRPKIGAIYRYTLVDPLHIDHFLTTAVDNTRVEKKTKWYESKPDKKEDVVTWNIYFNKKLVISNTTGEFTFKVGNQKYILEANLNGKKYTTSLTTLGGEPKLEVYWRDDYGSKITGKTVGYLDKIYLVIKTSHIPLGDTLQVTIYEDEYADGHGDSSRNMATFTTTPVNKNGYASVYFNNLQAFKTVLDKQDKINEDEHEFYAQIKYDSHINTIYDKTQIKVKNKAIKVIDPPVKNMPVIVGEVETGGIPEKKKKIDFTFGIIIDGTLNNMYNSEARQKFEQKHGVAKKQSDVDKFNEKKYRYTDESSYENDLSNPAIIFKNYIKDRENETHPVFRIYTEGIGTETKPDEFGQLNDKEYKNDDTVGYGLGTTSITSNTGIKKKVRQACEEMAKEISNYMRFKKDSYIGTITVDVFGFSRGAAAARNFVHEITYPAYHASPGLKKYRTDQHGYSVAEKYWINTSLPSNGHLGYMLTQANQTFQKLEIRFAGLYDTVPHHGAFQSNDIQDLGLNSINKADYVVHMAADDEHRANFDLVKINSVTKTPADSGKKGGIELFFPGVHCDVGGSYVDNKPENKHRIDALPFDEAVQLQTELINQGWFKKKELKLYFNNSELDENDSKNIYLTNILLDSKRPNVSNQYSFIPLHLMVEFCAKKKVVLDEKNINDIYKFSETNHIKGNVQFLDRIKSKLHDYAFKGAAKFEYEHQVVLQRAIVYATGDKTAVPNEEKRRKEEEVALNNEHNKDIMFLRNHYLHWNSVWGELGLNADIVLQPHHPNMIAGKRKREKR